MLKIFKYLKSIYPKGKLERFTFPLFIFSFITITVYFYFSPDSLKEKTIKYENINTIIIKDPNISKTKIDEIEKLELFSKKGQTGFIEKSDYTPIKKYLSAKKLQYLKNITNYYTMKSLNNGAQNNFFKYNLTPINMTTINDLELNKNNYSETLRLNNVSFSDNYIVKDNIGEYEVIVILNNTDSKNVLSKNIEQLFEMSFVCEKVIKYPNEKEVTLNSCITDIEYANEYFYNIMNNLNNNPSIINNSTKNFYYYMILSAYFLDDNSYCYNNIPYFTDNDMKICNNDLTKSRNQINKLFSEEKNNYLKYTFNISSSLKINLESLSNEEGFEVLDYKYLAAKMLEDKYDLYQLWQSKYIWDEINSIYDPKYPMKVLDMNLYNSYKLTHLNDIEAKLIAEKNAKNKTDNK